MPKLVIDDQEIEVSPGTKVIAAAEELGIMIPRFCYHPALGSVGACRVCAVKFLEGQVKGVQMSCMIDARDGMVVSTTDEEAVDFRKHVIEWLMLHHPHDCPVCDEGGHCLLQDMTVSGGHGLRRYPGKKRTHSDQYLGPLVQHEMNRCIQCYRCSRFYQEFTGYRDLGVMQIGNRVYFGRHQDGILESPFSGNLSDICPTGVYTDRPSRFIGRRWDYERSPSLCIHCSLGCHTVSSARYRQVVRLEARFSEAVNGYFICDRGRHGFHYAGLEDRPRRARLAGQEVPWTESVRSALERLGRISRESGSGTIACMGSTRSSLETQAMLKRICQMNGWREPAYWMDPSTAAKVTTAVSRLEEGLAVSLREIEQADFILTVGADPVNEAPMLAVAMRQAQRGGGQVVVLDPRPIALPFDFQHLPVASAAILRYLGLLLKGTVDREVAQALGQNACQFYDAIPAPEGIANSFSERISAVTQALRQSRKPVLVCGTEVVPEIIPAAAADFGLLLQAMDQKAGLFYVMPGANAFGAGLLSGDESSLESILTAIENKAIRALVLVETDPLRHFTDRRRLELALEKLDMLIVMDYLDSEAAHKAHVFFPTATLYEAGGVFVNQEGRIQAAPPAFQGGTPVSQVSGGSHPPREYGVGIPGVEFRPAWQALTELAGEKPQPALEITRAKLWDWLGEVIPGLADVLSLDEFPDEGVRLNPMEVDSARFATIGPADLDKKQNHQDSLELLTVDWTFGTEELSSYSPALRALEREPCLFMQKGDAERLGRETGARVAIQTDAGSLEVKLCVVKNMAPGVIILPRHRLLDWQKFHTIPKTVRVDQIGKSDV